MNIEILQKRLGRWHRDKWGEPSPTFMGAKLAEEVGEVCEAALKREQGHPKADQLDYGAELADVVIVALCAAAIHNVNLAAEVRDKVDAIDPVHPGDRRDQWGYLVCGECGDEVAFCGRNHGRGRA